MSDQAVVTLKDVDVEFHGKTRSVHAVDHVDLTVNRGDIYGIVGYSGAGKSTLVRTINLLLRPTGGSVNVLGQDMLALSPAQLRKERKRIGMIFQHFNLMNSRTIADNVAFPLKGIKSKQAIQKKVAELLDLVGLTDRANSYPAQLSGGQKQRVGIARALASDPEILISDEATSALDPKTTNQILGILKRLNEELGLTIVLITHEMQAIKEIANKVAVMEDGTIIERGSLLEIFTNPQQKLTKDFINTATNRDEALLNVRELLREKPLASDEQLYQINYVGNDTAQPLLSTIYADYQVTTNILYSNMEILTKTPVGLAIVVLKGADENIRTAVSSLVDHGVHVTQLDAEKEDA